MKSHLVRLLVGLTVFSMLLVGCNSTAATSTSTSAPAATTVAATDTTAATAATTPATTSTTAAATQSVSGTLTISGADALYPMMTKWSQEFQKVYPNVKFDVSAGGAGKGMTDALSGAVDIGMVSRTVTDQELAKGAYPISVTKDGVFATINAKNPVADKLESQGISKAMFIKIFITGEVTTWGQVVGDSSITDKISVYTRSDSCGAADMWAKFMGKYTQDDLKGIGVNGDPGVVQALTKDANGIGYNNLGYAFDLTTGKPTDGILVVPIDVSGDGKIDTDEDVTTLAKAVTLIASAKYPAPPSRFEYLVTNGKPKGLAAFFINWILTDGQKFVSDAGYVSLTADQIQDSLNKLK